MQTCAASSSVISYIKKFDDALCPCLESVVGFGERWQKTPKT